MRHADILVTIPENPPPDGIGAGYLAMRDGCRIRYATAPAAAGTEPRGTVLLLPGRNEYIEKYFETARDLAARGFGTAILDWRGQGGSDRELRDPDRGYIKRFDIYVDDLDAFFREVVMPDCRPPYSLLAHSTGALIALMAAPLFANRIRRMVLCAPLLALPASPMAVGFVRFLARFLHAVGLGRLYMPGRARRGKTLPFAGNRLTNDNERYARNQSVVAERPSLSIGGPTATWTRAMFAACERVSEPAFAADIRIPTLMLAAGRDRVVSTPAIERYTRRLRSASILTLDGARHELLQETDFHREQLLAAFDAFVPGDRTSERDTAPA